MKELLLILSFLIEMFATQPLRYYVRVEPNGHVKYLSSTVIPWSSEVTVTEAPSWNRKRVSFIPEDRIHFVTKEPIQAFEASREPTSTTDTIITTTNEPATSQNFNSNSVTENDQRQQKTATISRTDNDRFFSNRRTRPFFTSRSNWGQGSQFNRNRFNPNFVIGKRIRHPNTAFTRRSQTVQSTTNTPWTAPTTRFFTTNTPWTAPTTHVPTTNTPWTTTTTRLPPTRVFTTTATPTTEFFVPETTTTTPRTTTALPTTRLRYYERVRYTFRTRAPFDFNRAENHFSTFVPARFSTLRPRFHFTRRTTTAIPTTTEAITTTTEIPTTQSKTTQFFPTTTERTTTEFILPTTTTTQNPITTVITTTPSSQTLKSNEDFNQVRIQETSIQHEVPMDVNDFEMSRPDSSNVGKLMEDVYQLQYEVSIEKDDAKRNELKDRLANLESQLETNILQFRNHKV